MPALPAPASPDPSGPDAGTDARAAFVRTLAEARAAYGRPPWLRDRSEALARAALGLLFPHFSPACRPGRDALADELDAVGAALREVLGPLVADPAGVAGRWLAALPDVRAALLDDARATCEADPAATGVDEVVLAYPGFLATALYRLAHGLHGAGVPLLPRLLTAYGHRETGIDVHPGARIGRAFSIDHGTGVVIGETAVVGDRVRLYQGVTLGALAVEKALARTKRHPTLEADVVVYANATILGGETVVGAGSVVGGNVWLTRSVPPGAVVTRSTQVRHAGGVTEELLDYYL